MRRLRLNSPWKGAPILYTRRTGSTMADALRLQKRGYPEGTVVAAGYQVSGKGRESGRVWHSNPGRNLLFSLLIDTLLLPQQLLPLLIGLGLAQTLERLFGLAVQVKWPNDLLFGNRKLAGVLCEAPVNRPGQVRFLVGVGLNVNQIEFPEELTATSLGLILGENIDAWSVLEQLLYGFAAVLRNSGWRAELERRLYLRGEKVTLVQSAGDTGTDPETCQGILHGLSVNGALQLKQGKRITEFVSGELIVH